MWSVLTFYSREAVGELYAHWEQAFLCFLIDAQCFLHAVIYNSLIQREK